MITGKTQRGFSYIKTEPYNYEPKGELRIVVQESSAIGDRDRPGASFLWIGSEFHFDRVEVLELVSYLKNWLKTGELLDEEPDIIEDPCL